ncbi:hypothetical protein BASA61_003363 [Batrachochytrium salamandrivorans]|nr:hypothetical protein BASA61_003363 [Batrachochytrium salamandrivorans]
MRSAGVCYQPAQYPICLSGADMGVKCPALLKRHSVGIWRMRMRHLCAFSHRSAGQGGTVGKESASECCLVHNLEAGMTLLAPAVHERQARCNKHPSSLMVTWCGGDYFRSPRLFIFHRGTMLFVARSEYCTGLTDQLSE